MMKQLPGIAVCCILAVVPGCMGGAPRAGGDGGEAGDPPNTLDNQPGGYHVILPDN